MQAFRSKTGRTINLVLAFLFLWLVCIAEPVLANPSRTDDNAEPQVAALTAAEMEAVVGGVADPCTSWSLAWQKQEMNYGTASCSGGCEFSAEGWVNPTPAQGVQVVRHPVIRTESGKGPLVNLDLTYSSRALDDAPGGVRRKIRSPRREKFIKGEGWRKAWRLRGRRRERSY
jgi:hypothetical protein